MAKKFTGTPEEEAAYQKGVQDERDRMLKILVKFHDTFGKEEDISKSETSMKVAYMYNFIVESRPVK